VQLGIPTPACHVLDLRDPACPLPFPVIIKPVHEGSTVGLFVCKTADEWAAARRDIETERTTPEGDRCYMIESCISHPTRRGGKARELTVGLLDNQPLPVIEITPADGLYDYEAKYTRTDTAYTVAPQLPGRITETIQRQTAELARAMNIRHLARADFMLDGDGPDAIAWFLEINTLPGFTDHSLVPMAGRHIGLPMPVLCSKLVDLALRDR
jgi:D-alanine-D-alanine ligase